MRLADDIFTRLPQIDILINNGGRSQRSLCIDTNMDVYQALMELNYLGTVSITKQVLPHMTQRRAGSIVTVSSGVGLIGVPLGTGYAATKHALQVKANASCVLWGFLSTFFTLGRLSQVRICSVRRVSSTPSESSWPTFRTYTSAQSVRGL